MPPKVAKKSRETETLRTRPSDSGKEKKVPAPTPRRAPTHCRRRAVAATTAKKRRLKKGLGDNVGRDDAKWPLGRRSASVVLKLETVEIGKRMYDLKSTRLSEQLEDASPDATSAQYGTSRTGRVWRSSNGSEVVVAPWQKLPAADRRVIFRHLCERKNNYTVWSALSLMTETVDEPECRLLLHSVAIDASDRQLPRLKLEVTYDRTEMSPWQLFLGIGGSVHDEGESAFAHAYRAGDDNWTVESWRWDDALDAKRYPSSDVSGRPVLKFDAKRTGDLSSMPEIRCEWTTPKKFV